ncbi:hypothetical protein BG004_003397 [Podila humilis]|nr:hypothetical protein BG004_003397 [Podila humilis]
MASRFDESIRIVDKRQTDAGAEYLYSITGEWSSSSDSKRNTPELVELYEWLHSHGFQKDEAAFATTQLKSLTAAKSARKRFRSTQRSDGPASSTTPETLLRSSSVASAETTDIQGGSIADTTHEAVQNGTDGSISAINHERSLKKIKLDGDAVQQGEGSEELSNAVKLTRGESFIEGINDLRLGVEPCDVDDPELADQPSVTAEAATATSPFTKPESMNFVNSTRLETSKVLEFNRNQENMCSVYFSEGMDASGVEMIDILLGPTRKPTRMYVAEFFYGIVLSPATDIGTIEAALHVLERILALHGPEPFQLLWEVQKRRLELNNGNSGFSKTSSMAAPPDGNERDNWSSNKPLGLLESATDMDGPSSMDVTSSRRLPAWTNVWELFKALMGLDTKPETKQYIALQEYQIKSRIFGDGIGSTSMAESKSTSNGSADSAVEDEFESMRPKKKAEYKPGDKIPEEQQVREEVGRSICGLLLKVLETDAVVKNLINRTYFRRYVMTTDAYSQSLAVRQALDSVFEFITLGTSSRYISWMPIAPKTIPEAAATSARGGSKTNKSTVTVWPLNNRATLDEDGEEILQLGIRILLLLIRFVQAGQLLTERGLEELARETVSRLGKVNRERALRPGQNVSQGVRERCNLDQTEIFLTALIEGPSMPQRGRATTTVSASTRRPSNQINHKATEIGESEVTTMTPLPTGVVVGSSVFVVAVVDLWFRSTKSTTGHSSGFYQPSFQRIVDEYSVPCTLRPNPEAPISIPPAAINSTRTRAGRASRSQSVEMPPSRVAVSAAEVSAGDDNDMSEFGHEKWHARDVEQLEWTVMMMEVLIKAWIHSRGIRRQDIEGTSLNNVLFPSEDNSANTSASAGWQAMSNVLALIGGTLKARWDNLESVIEAAIMAEEQGLN